MQIDTNKSRIYTRKIDLNKLMPYIENNKLGYITKLSETGKLDGYDTISTGKGDLGGKSYGSHQLRSTRSNKNIPSTLEDFLIYSGYDIVFKDFEYVSAKFDAKWVELSNTDPVFNNLQDEYIYRTHYMPMELIFKSYGMDVSNRSYWVKELVYSTANQYGAGRIGRSLVKTFANNNGKTVLTDVQFIWRLTETKCDTVDTFFRSSIARGTKPLAITNRFNKEQNILIELMSIISR
jgi:hypothetical protein